MNLSPGELNYIDKDTIIYKQGDSVDTIGFVMEGTVIKSTLQTQEEILPRHFIGVHSLYSGVYSSTFTATTDVKIKALKADSPNSLSDFLSGNQQFHQEMIIEISILIAQLYELYNKLYTQSVIIYNFTKNMCEQFKSLSQETNFICNNVDFQNPQENYSFSSQPFYNEYLTFSNYTVKPELAYADLSAGRIKFLNTQTWLIREIYSAYDRLVEYVVSLTNHLSGNNDYSILFGLSNLVSHSNNNKLNTEKAVSLMKKLLETTKTIEFSLKRKCYLPLKVDYFYINNSIKTSINAKSKYKDSLEAIFDYVDLPEELKAEFKELLDSFVALTDKLSKKDEHRKLFKRLTQLYYEFYESAFLKYVTQEEKSKIIELFLDFGFIDESLLTSEELEFLINIGEIKESYPCKMFRMKDWLTEIYEGREFASKNEFDEDYFDFARQEKKLNALSQTEEKRLLENPVLRVQFEINNMFKYNNRLINGKMLTFVPFLHSEGFESTMEKMYLPPEKINSYIASVREIDYSLFYREFMYADTSAKIDKEMIQKEVFPIIVLFPIAGQNAIMWQETTRRRSDSAGRFFMPSFFIGNLEDTLLKTLGRFRWELCKQMLGVSWNNPQIPSLTAKYFDYVQFYKKENELSADRKEALKKQIVSCRNKINEVFISDYMTWIKYESTGAVRLNTIARRILATHCPFNAEIRVKLSSQPLFEKAMLRYNLDKAKKIKELRNRFITLEKKKATLTQELLDTQRFYNDL